MKFIKLVDMYFLVLFCKKFFKVKKLWGVREKKIMKKKKSRFKQKK
jgi:hypothetical protein